MTLDYSQCPPSDQNDSNKKARTEEFFGLAGKVELSETELRTLVNQGICLEAKDNDGWTALIRAANNGHIDIVKALLDRGAQIEAKDNVGKTALMWAASNGHTDTVQALLAEGAQIEAKDDDGRTALIRAAWNGYTGTVQALLDRGAQIEAKSNGGSTALMWAANNRHTDTVQALLDRGANIYARTKGNERPIDYDAVSKHRQLQSWQSAYEDFVEHHTPPANKSDLYHLLAVTPLVDEDAKVDYLGNIRKIMTHAQWQDKGAAAAMLADLAKDGSITAEQAADIYQSSIAPATQRRIAPRPQGRGI